MLWNRRYAVNGKLMERGGRRKGRWYYIFV